MSALFGPSGPPVTSRERIVEGDAVEVRLSGNGGGRLVTYTKQADRLVSFYVNSTLAESGGPFPDRRRRLGEVFDLLCPDCSSEQRANAVQVLEKSFERYGPMVWVEAGDFVMLGNVAGGSENWHDHLKIETAAARAIIRPQRT